MITVHHLNNSRSQRILWLLEEFEIPYEIVKYERGPDMLAPAELKRIHPLGKSPVIKDGDRVVAESGAIIEYLLDRYGQGRLRPADDSPERLRFTYWMYYAESAPMPLLLLTLIFKKMVETKKPFFIQPIVKALSKQVHKTFIDPNLKTHFDYMERELAAHSWFAGAQFSAADIMMSFPIEAARSRGVIDASRPQLMKYLDQIHARPAYQRAIARGGPYDYSKEIG